MPIKSRKLANIVCFENFNNKANISCEAIDKCVVIDWVIHDCFRSLVEVSGIVRKLFMFKRYDGLSSG